jgi:hypothetical protein
MTIIIRIINALAVAVLLAGVFALLSSLSPALAGDRPMTQRQIDERIAGCIRDYGERYRDRCVQIMEDPSAIGRRARQGYEWRRLEDEIERERECWDNPRIVNPRACFEAPARNR